MDSNGHEPSPDQQSRLSQQQQQRTLTLTLPTTAATAAPSAIPSIPDSLPPSHCCCGNIDCAFLRQTHDAFDALEENLRTAGSLGQARLVRHEAYVVEAEREKATMVAEIESLSLDKRELEIKNDSALQENRDLMDMLDNANMAVSDSDLHIQSLTSTLQSAQQELYKLNNLASRTDTLERELEQYEREQANMHATLAHKTEEEKSATLRWQDAERRLAAFEHQLEVIEKDARQERERHVEIVGRMERQRVVEKELDTANGRLRGAAAAKTTSPRDKHGSGVVSHFVKDILQDNANLQMGIVELRDLLTTSNDEVERLRDQLAQYFPQPQIQDDDPPDPRRMSSLSQEMSRASTQELHVHHHYHAPTSSTDSSRRHSQPLRRPKKKRQGLTPAVLSPTSGSRTPRSSISATYSPTSALTPSSSTAILSQTAVTVPNLRKPPHRWSMQSAYTIDSSTASSPPSTTYQAPSLFDRGFSDVGMDSSRPTTPDSEDLGSPLFPPVQSKRSSAGYFRNTPAVPFRYSSADDSSTCDRPSAHSSHEPDLDLATPDHDIILEEDEQDLLATGTLPTRQRTPSISRFEPDSNLGSTTPSSFHPRLHRRAASHESLVSISGMDIHTLKSRPSQLLTVQGGRSFSTQPLLSATTAHAARPTLMPRNSDSSRNLLSGMAADQRALPSRTPSRPTLGKKVGGWVFGRWTSSPSPTVISVVPPQDIQVQRLRKNDGPLKTPASPTKLRPPGINQAGPIFGFGREPRLSPEPIMTTLDAEALRQSLDE